MFDEHNWIIFYWSPSIFVFYSKPFRQFLYVAKAEILVDFLHYRVAYISNNVAEWIISKEVLLKFLKYNYGFVHGRCSINIGWINI